MKNLNNFWLNFKLLILIIWAFFSFDAIISAFEGHMITLNIVVAIDLIIAIYFVFIKKNK